MITIIDTNLKKKKTWEWITFSVILLFDTRWIDLWGRIRMHLAFILMLFCYCCGGFIILLRHVVLKRRRAREREKERVCVGNLSWKIDTKRIGIVAVTVVNDVYNELRLLVLNAGIWMSLCTVSLDT